MVRVRVNVNGQWIEDLVKPRLLPLDFLRRYGFEVDVVFSGTYSIIHSHKKL